MPLLSLIRLDPVAVAAVAALATAAVADGTGTDVTTGTGDGNRVVASPTATDSRAVNPA